MSPSKNNFKISVILPCLNEEGAIGTCLDELTELIKNQNLDAEVIVVDNNSSDKTTQVAETYLGKISNLKIVSEEMRGYGAAYLKGIKEASGKYVFFCDADNTYGFSDLLQFIKKLDEGADFVIGDRFAHKLSSKVMPWHNRYIGNPFLSGLVRFFFDTNINDIHCGKRAVKRDVLNSLSLSAPGMEFASEMVIKAVQKDCGIAELPIHYRPRIGDSKLRPFRDGFRHLFFILRSISK